MPQKTVLITGASRGIGRAAAIAAARARLVGRRQLQPGRRAPRRKSSRRLREVGGRAVALRGDVAREDDVVGMFESAENALGPITDVVVNAGVVAPAAKLADMSLERMRRVFEVKYSAPTSPRARRRGG